MNNDYPRATIDEVDVNSVLNQLHLSGESNVRIENVTFRLGEAEGIFKPDAPEHKGWFKEEDHKFDFLWDISELGPGEHRAVLTVLDVDGRIGESAWWKVKGENGIWRNVK